MIIKRVQKGDYPTYQQLLDYVQRESEFLDEDFYLGFSQRTLQRDFREIRTIFGIDIQYSRSEKGYFVDSEVSEHYSFNQLLETYDVLQLFKTKERTKTFLFFEQSQPKGTEFFNGILYAIEHRKQLAFDYEKFWEDTVKKRTVSPLGLKEHNSRWYLVAKNEKGYLRTFALDRFRSFEVTDKPFDYPKGLDIEQLYAFNCGISITEAESPQKVVFATSPFQAKYFKSLPLHHTQKVLQESDEEVLFSLKLKLTDELIYKLLSQGERLKVLQPQALIDEMAWRIEEMQGFYNK